MTDRKKVKVSCYLHMTDGRYAKYENFIKMVDHTSFEEARQMLFSMIFDSFVIKAKTESGKFVYICSKHIAYLTDVTIEEIEEDHDPQ